MDPDGRANLKRQRDEFAQTLREGLIRSYAKGLLAFGGAEMVIKGVEASPQSARIASVTQLVYGTAEGWHGKVEDIVIFHFVDGTGGVDEERAVNKRYVNAYDMFYKNEELLKCSDSHYGSVDEGDPPVATPYGNCTGPLTNASSGLFDQVDGIREFLLRSRWEKPPDENNLQECVLYISETPA